MYVVRTKNLRITTLKIQYYGYGTGIRCPCDPWIRNPGWVKTKILIRDEPKTKFFGLNLYGSGFRTGIFLTLVLKLTDSFLFASNG
jgi:hypothetical protein